LAEQSRAGVEVRVLVDANGGKRMGKQVVDGQWCAIGSSNFDDRSFEINDEITLGISDARLARQLEEIFMNRGLEVGEK
jgi:phosphatidylserine/phosphatidylglycerophosphate/cardiolipin synthase-like enzyme